MDESYTKKYTLPLYVVARLEVSAKVKARGSFEEVEEIDLLAIHLPEVEMFSVAVQEIADMGIIETLLCDADTDTDRYEAQEALALERLAELTEGAPQ